jgi:hypothetical protein
METAPIMEKESESNPVTNGQEWIRANEEELQRSLPKELASLWEKGDPQFFMLALTQMTGRRVTE